MRKSNQRRGPLAGFAIGVLFCFIGMSLILYLSWGFIKDSLKASKNPNNYAEEQSLPIDNNGDPVLNDSANQSNTGVGLDGTIKPPLGESPDLEAYPAPTYSNGQLGVAQGAGGMGHLKKVPGQYTSKEEFVHKNVHTSLMNMIFAAKNDGISLNLVSAFRSYSHQKRIWENKWGNSADDDTGKAKSILRYSSFPGTSRHHWGTDVDFNSVSLSFWNTAQGKKIHNWLTKNGPQFGFCQIYAPGRGKGYSDEPWHWTHAYTASQYYNQLSNPQVLNTAISQDIKGAAAVRKIPDEMMSYITGISGCRSVPSVQQQPNYKAETEQQALGGTKRKRAGQLTPEQEAEKLRFYQQQLNEQQGTASQPLDIADRGFDSSQVDQAISDMTQNSGDKKKNSSPDGNWFIKQADTK